MAQLVELGASFPAVIKSVKIVAKINQWEKRFLTAMERIELLTEEKIALEKIARRATAAQRLVKRAKIILQLAAGINHSQIARQLGINREQVSNWGERWQSGQDRLKGVVG